MSDLLLKTRVVTLDANGSGVDHQSGEVLIIDSLSAGPMVNVTWIDGGGNDAGQVLNVTIGRTLHAGGQFSGYRLDGVAGSLVTLMIGPKESDAYNTLTTSVVIGHVIVDTAPEIEIKNDVGNPVPVTGAVTSTALLPSVLTNVAPVACTAVIAALLAIDATRRLFRAYNVGPDPVALVAAAGTFANAAIYIQPGETWNEKDAPGAAWFAICDAAKTATVNLFKAA
jgi:hypothetical protein